MFSPIQPYLVLPFFLHVRDISLLWSFSKIILLPCHQLFYLILLDSISFGGLQLPNCILCIAICALGISPCQKWWQTILEIKGKKIDMLIQIVLHALLRGPFFSFTRRTFLFPICFHHVLMRFLTFSSCCPRHYQ